MKILFFTSSGAPTGLYGGSVALLNLIKGLSVYDDIVLAAVFPDHGVLSDKCEKLGIKCYYTFRYTLTTCPSTNNFKQTIEAPLRFGMMLLRRFIATKELLHIIDDFKPDIIHTNVGPLDIAHNASIKKNIPHVWHIREYQDLDFGMRFFPSKKSFFKKIHHKNNHLIAITKGVFNHFNMKNSDKVIYDGVFEKKTQCDISEKEDYFLFVGSLKDAKGVKLILIAYIDYIKQNGQLKLLLAGSGGPKSYETECIKLVKENNLEERVTFLGFRNDVYQLMGKAKALIVPSRFEGFGFITAEAMYNNCLVIGRNTGGTKEQLDNGLSIYNEEIGIRFTTREELTNCLHKVEHMEITKYKTIVNNAFKTANQLYNNEGHVKTVLNYFNEVNKLRNQCIKN